MRLGAVFCILTGAAVLAGTVTGWASDARGPLTLPRAIAAALARDALVLEAQQSVEEAKVALLHTRAHTPSLGLDYSTSASQSSGLDPQSEITGTSWSSQGYNSFLSLPLSGGARVGLSTSASTSTTNSSLREGGGQNYTYAGAGVSVSYSQPLPLFRNEWVLTDAKQWAAGISLRQAELALAAAKRDVVEQTLQIFYAAVRAQRQAEIVRASAQQADELLRIAQEKFQHGRLAEIEALEAQVAASRARVSVQGAEANAAAASDALKNLLGIPLEEEVQVTYEETKTAAPAGAASDLLAQAMTQRLDLQQTALGLRLAELSVQQTEAATRPGVALVGGYSLSGQAQSISECWGQLVNPSWSVGLATSLNLTRREDRADIEQARRRLRVSRLSYQLQQDQVRLEIRDLIRRADQTASAITVLADTVKLAEENLRIRQTQFEHGLVRPIDVAQTERELSETRTQYLEACLDSELARAQLELAVGRLPEGVVEQSEMEEKR